jgi:predicted nucleic-acid-binding protein
VRAVDTNILARYYLHDDAVQALIAAGLLSAGDVFVPKTVVLELEWVLQYVADQPENKMIECLAHLIALPGVTVEDRDEIEAALGYCRNGMDSADALHLAASKSCSELLTFDDRGYARRAKKAPTEANGPSAATLIAVRPAHS